MKRNRIDNDEKLADPNYNPNFFQNNLGTAARNPQTYQRNIHDFPDFMLHFLRLNPSTYIPEITAEPSWGTAIFVVDARKLLYPVQWGWDFEGHPLVCLRLNGKLNERGILTIYRDSQNFWKYCFCDLNCIFSPFQYDDNNSKLGNMLTDLRVPYQQKVSILQRMFDNLPEISSAPVFQ